MIPLIAALICTVPQGTMPMSTQRCYEAGKQGSDAIREKEINDELHRRSADR